MWTNKYIGIPYLENGRDAAGADCWGLVRHIYKEELDIDLPSFYTDYKVSDTDRISELMSQYKEGWEQLSLPEEKCVVLFRIMGKVAHIGVMINEHQFIHNRRNQNTSIDSINNVRWDKRVVGFFRYSEKSAEKFKELPIALKSKELVVEVEEGFTIGNAFDSIYQMEEIPEELKSRILVYVDGELVALSENKNTVLKAGQKIEYRLVPNDQGTLRSILTVAVVVAAVSVGGWAAATYGQSFATMTGLTVTQAGATVSMLASMGTMAIGMALVNAIAPLRLTEPNMNNPDNSNPQLLLSGARNEPRQYEAIPVVLGTYRYVPPLAATNFLSVESDISYLRMLLCWGADTLVVDPNTLKVGATAYNDFLNKSTGTPPKTDVITLGSNNTTSPALELYGQNVFQKVPNLNIAYTNGTEVDAIYQTIPSNVTSLSVSTHFPQGLRGIWKTGNSAGQPFAVSYNFIVKVRKLDPNTLLPVDATTTSNPNSPGWIYPGVGFQAQTVKLAATSAKVSATVGIDPNTAQSVAVWTYGTGYTTNIVYMDGSTGVLCVISGTPTTAPANTTGISDVTLNVTYGGRWGDPIYSLGAYTNSPAAPTVPAGGKPLYSIITQYTDSKAGNFSIYSTTDLRTANGFTGATNGNITATSVATFPPTVSLNTGGLTTPVTSFSYGQSGQNYYLRKDAFTDTVTFVLDQTNPCPYDVYIRRTTDAVLDYTDRYEYKSAVLYLITGYNAKLAAVNPPKGVPITVSGLKIQATDQLNGSIEGINALVQSTCIDYDIGTSSWTTVKRPTNNPAALFRYVLQHPTNIQAISDTNIASKVDLVALADWYVFCNTNGLTYNSVIVQKRSLLEVMRDICAAGRASPVLINNKWSVVIDQPRTTIVQHFTPHNSWGFEANRLLTNAPHALRVNIVSADRNYDNKELTVYSYATKIISVTTTSGSTTATVPDTTVLYPTNTEYNTQYATASATVAFKPITIVGGSSITSGTTISNIVSGTQLTLSAPATATGTTNITFNVPYYLETATLFETISLPGVTNETQAIKLAKFHLAQAILRPETYSLNVDMEHLVCNRGDLVRVTHDVPMWGTATGRFKDVYTNLLTYSEQFDNAIWGKQNITLVVNSTTAPDGTLTADTVTNTASLGSYFYQTISLNFNTTYTKTIYVKLAPTNTVPVFVSTVYKGSGVGIESQTAFNLSTLAITGVDVATSSITSVGNGWYRLTHTFTTVASGVQPTNGVFYCGAYGSTTLVGSFYVWGAQLEQASSAYTYIPTTSTISSVCYLDNELSMAAGASYSIRIRSSSGTSTSKAIQTVGTQGYYRYVTLPSGILSTEGKANDLYMIGTINTESTEALITSIEPASNLTAKISFVDYAPSLYTSFTSLNSLGSFDNNITSTIAFFNQYISSIPIIVTASIRSDESVMTMSGNSYVYNISIPYTNPPGLETSVSDIEYRMCLTNDTSLSWRHQGFVKLGSGNIVLSDVVENQSYTIQLRYVSASGFVGPWSTEATHTIVGKATPPVTVVGFTSVISGSAVKLSWTKNTEIDIVGYEIRTANSGWGTTTGIVFKGDAISTSDSAPTFGTTMTWYIKAIDAAGNYSTTAASTALSITRPNDVTSITYEYSANTTGQATVLVKWVAPTVPGTSLPTNKYQITFTKPSMTAVTAEVGAGSNSILLNADWAGTATFSINTIDNIGTASLGTSASVIKVAPGVPTAAATPVAVTGSSALLSWVAPTVTSLPIAGYQLSTSNADPTITAYIFKGNASVYTIGSIASGLNTWYLWSYDTAGKYSATPLTISRTFGGAAAPTITTKSFLTNTAIFKWTAPTSDFTIDGYQVTLTATGMTTKTAYLYTTEWEVPVDWVNTTATFSVYAKDIAGISGATASGTLAMALPSAPTLPTFTVKGAGITVGWTTAVQGSLPIAGYQLSSSNADPKITPYIYKGTISSIDIPSVVSGSNTWYVYAYDTMGNYCSIPLTATKTYAGPSTPTISSSSFASTTATFKWVAPTSDFLIDSYTVSLTAAGMTTKNAVLYTTEWTVPVDWVNTTATISVTAKDIAGFTSTTATSTLAMTLPGAPTTPTFTVKGGGVTIGWTSATQGSLPIAGYQLSTSSTAPTTNPYIYKGSSSTIDVVSVSSTNTWYLFAYDTLNNYCATPLTITKTFSGPGAPVFTGITGTNPRFTLNTAYFKWLPPTTSDFAIAYYNLTLTATGMSTQTAKINTTEWEIPVGWSNTTATLTIVPVDVAGLSYTGASNTLTLTKALPTTPSAPVLLEVGTDLDVDWADNSQNISTQLGISGYEIRDYTNNMIWRGTSSKAQVSMITKKPVYTATWSRATTTVTITKNTHGYQTGNLIYISATSDALAIPIGTYSIIVTDANTYTVVGLNAGSTTGSITIGYAYSLYAIDYNNEYSTPYYFTYTPALPVDITANTFLYSFGNSLTDASLSLTWTGVTPVFGLNYYELSYDSVIVKLSVTSYDIFPLPNNWVGNKTFTIKVVDMLGNSSAGTSITINKQLPSSIPSYSAQVIDNNVMLYWTLPARTSLPVTNVRIKKGSTWNSATNIGDKNGTFTTIFEQQGGPFTYWMAAVDTDKQESIPISFPVTVAQPPDFIFNGAQTSSFTGSTLNTASTFDKGTGMLVTGNVYTDTGTINIWKSGRASIGLQPGNKYYWEITILNSTGINPNIMLGIGSSIATINNYVGADTSGIGYYGNGGTKYINGVAAAFGAAYTTGDIIGFALDNINNTLSIYKNNVLQGSAISITAATTWYPMVSLYAGTIDQVSVNYGGSAFNYPIPDGYNGYNSAFFTGTSVVLPVDNTVSYAGHFTDIRVLTMAVSAGGTGYAVGDTFRLNTGTVRNTNNYATGTVSTVASGVVTGITITEGGAYTATPTVTAGATTTLTGTGTGLTVNITTGGNWAGPSSQQAAGYNIYIQPTLATGYYEEIFDFGTPLASSQITLTYNGSTVDGSPIVISSMSTSLTNAAGSYSSAYSSNTMFATNFRYVKVRIAVSQNDVGKGLYNLNYLNLRLDSKIINWSGTTTCATTIAGSPNNADGTLANFGKEFVDISAIAITPTGVAPSYPVYDFKDVVLSGTYVVSGNVCTVTTSVPHGFSGNAIGQKVRLSFSSGTATSGIYDITSVSGGTLGTAGSYNASTVFTVAMTTANTSGNVSAYSQGMRIYLFDQTGARTSGTVSWSIRGN